MTDVLEASTTIHAPRSAVYDLLLDVEGYGTYSDHVRRVTRDGDGGPGTEYDVTFAWWVLTYTIRVQVTDLDPSGRVGWRVVDGLDANGVCHLEPTDADEPDVDHATRVVVTARFDPDSVDDGAFPSFLPIASVVERLRPFVEREAERVLARVVSELEGRPRRATLTVRTRSGVD